MIDFKIVENNTFGVKLAGVGQSDVEPPSTHVCREGMKVTDRFFYVKRGCIHFDLPGGRQLEACAGDIVYLPSDCTYVSHWESSETGGYVTIMFKLYGKDGSSCSPGDSIEIVMNDRTKKYYSYFKRMFELWISGELGSFCACNSVFWEILQNFYVDCAIKSIKDEYDRIYKVILYMRNNYQTDVTSEELAKLCGMSMTSFRREFKQRVGMSPTKYKNHLRLEKARQLLEYGDCSVSEASRLVGLPDIYYFSKLFKREFGVNPSDCMPR